MTFIKGLPSLNRITHAYPERNDANRSQVILIYVLSIFASCSDKKANTSWIGVNVKITTEWRNALSLHLTFFMYQRTLNFACIAAVSMEWALTILCASFLHSLWFVSHSISCALSSPHCSFYRSDFLHLVQFRFLLLIIIVMVMIVIIFGCCTTFFLLVFVVVICTGLSLTGYNIFEYIQTSYYLTHYVLPFSSSQCGVVCVCEARLNLFVSANTVRVKRGKKVCSFLWHGGCCWSNRSRKKFNSTDNDRYSKCIKFCCSARVLFCYCYFFRSFLSTSFRALSFSPVVSFLHEFTFSRIFCIHLRLAVFAVVFRFYSFDGIGHSAEWCEHLQNIFVQHRQ